MSIRHLMPRLAMALALAAVMLAAARSPAAAQNQAAVAPAPESIPVPEIAKRGDEVIAYLRGLEALVGQTPAIDTITQRLPEVSERVTQRLSETKQTVEARPAVTELDSLAESWKSIRLDLSAWIEMLTGRATRLEQDLVRLGKLRETWTRARTDARASRAPDPVIERIDSILAALGAWHARLEAQRATTLVLQDRVARELARCEDALALIAVARQKAAGQLVRRDSPPIWSSDFRAQAWRELPGKIRGAAAVGRAQVRRFVEDGIGRILGQIALFLVLVPLFVTARRLARECDGSDERVADVARVFAHPVAPALVLTLLSSLWLYPQGPRAVRALVGTGTLPPMLMIVRHLVDPVAVAALYVVGAFFVAETVRDLTKVEPLLEQTFLILEMLAAIAVLLTALISLRRRQGVGERPSPLVVGIRVGGRAATLMAAAALVSAAVGNLSLARLLGSTLVDSSYLSLVLYTGVRVADALIAFLLRTRPLRLLQSVVRHRALIEARAHAALGWIAAGSLVLITLSFLGLLIPLADTTRRTLATTLTPGKMSISLGDVLAFLLTVWLAYMLSRLVRFVLDEDVYPRLNLAEGLPYAVSSLLNYAILFVGFLLALLALGLDLNRVTILGGALGVGIGFGLQNVVNNFVSGLIVLFERPIRVGDSIQLADLQGEVRRIGIRSSTVRTFEGAEVIVPNAMLISERVANWTLSDRMRRIDLSVGVAYGTAPDKVLQLLREVARANPDVVSQPAPLALFLGFGDSALQFQLRVWTDRLDRSLVIKSELGVALYAALQEAGMDIPFPQQEVRLRREPDEPA